MQILKYEPHMHWAQQVLHEQLLIWLGRGGWEGFGVFELVEYCKLFFPWRIRGSCWNQNGEQTRLLRIAEDAGETETDQRARLGSARDSHYNPSGYSGGCPAGHCLIYSVEKIKGLWRQVKWAPWTWNLTFERMFGLIILKVWLWCFSVLLFFFLCSLTFSTLSMFQILSIVSITVENISGASKFG